MSKSQEALKIASDRIQAKYGFPCSLAVSQLQQIEAAATHYRDLDLPDPKVHAIQFIE
ncbi:MAG: hypothetical protein ACFCU8_17340 [Thermosynechococcaceae cyanobacterium]